MRHSEKRILTTHAGSLPRPRELAEMFGRLSRHEPIDGAALEGAALEATRRVVHMQAECGIDVGNNGEQSRESFFTYVQHRMSGFGGQSQRLPASDVTHYPTYVELFRSMRQRMIVNLFHAPKAIGEVRYVNRAPLDTECHDFSNVLAEVKPGFVEPFMTAPSPGIIAAAMFNEHYKSLEDYLTALADALRVEYETITSRGFTYAGATTRDRITAMSRSTTSCPISTGRASARCCSRWRIRVTNTSIDASSAIRFPPGCRSSPVSSTRPPTTSNIPRSWRIESSALHASSATRIASWRGRTAASKRRPAWVTSPKNWCGRSCAPFATAPPSPRIDCFDGPYRLIAAATSPSPSS